MSDAELGELGGLFAVRKDRQESIPMISGDVFVSVDVGDIDSLPMGISRSDVMKFILVGRKSGELERIGRHDYRIGNRDVFRAGQELDILRGAR